MQIGEIIKAKRLNRSWTQLQLAKKLYTSASTVGIWERGENYPTLTFLVGLSKVFECSIDELVGDSR